jgi:hypothetical protein
MDDIPGVRGKVSERLSCLNIIYCTGFRDWILPVLVRYLSIGVRNKREIVKSFENMSVKHFFFGLDPYPEVCSRDPDSSRLPPGQSGEVILAIQLAPAIVPASRR